MQSDEREESPDLLANFIHDTTRKLENLTNELNNHDNDDFKIASKHIENNLKETIDTESADSSNETLELDDTNCPKELNGTSTSVNEPTDCAYTTKLQRFLSQPTPPSSLEALQTISTNNTNNVVPHDFPKSLENSHNGVEHTNKGITIEKHSSLSLNLMQSVELEGK